MKLRTTINISILIFILTIILFMIDYKWGDELENMAYYKVHGRIEEPYGCVPPLYLLQLLLPVIAFAGLIVLLLYRKLPKSAKLSELPSAEEVVLIFTFIFVVICLFFDFLVATALFKNVVIIYF